MHWSPVIKNRCSIDEIIHHSETETASQPVCVLGCDEPSEENHLAWRRDRETNWIPDVDQTEGTANVTISTRNIAVTGSDSNPGRG